MDFSFKKLFFHSIIVNYLVFFITTQGFEISKTTETWDNAANRCLDNKLYKVKDNVLDDLDPHMSPGDELWVGARAKLTHYVSWDGCWKINVPTAKQINITDNSLASCLDYCNKYTRIALQNEVCSCINDEGRQYLGRAPIDKSYCNNRCNGNMNDICGGADTFVSLYTRHLALETITSTSGRCLAVIPKTLIWRGTHCDDTTAIHGYLCEINNENQAIDISLPWDQAFRKCLQQNGVMTFPRQRSIIGLPLEFYWTSLRQSSAIHWQSKSDEEFPFCVSIMKTHTHGCLLQEEDCSIKHRFICDDEVLSSFPVLAIVLIVGVVILLCVVAMLAFIIWRHRHQTAQARTTAGNPQMLGQLVQHTVKSNSVYPDDQQHGLTMSSDNAPDDHQYGFTLSSDAAD